MVYLNPTRFKKQQEANNNKIKWVDNDLLKQNSFKVGVI